MCEVLKQLREECPRIRGERPTLLAALDEGPNESLTRTATPTGSTRVPSVGLVLCAMSVWFCVAGQWIPLAVLWGVPTAIRLAGSLLLTETRAARLILSNAFEDVEITDQEADSVTAQDVRALLVSVMAVDAIAISSTLAGIVYCWT